MSLSVQSPVRIIKLIFVIGKLRFVIYLDVEALADLLVVDLVAAYLACDL